MNFHLRSLATQPSFHEPGCKRASSPRPTPPWEEWEEREKAPNDKPRAMIGLPRPARNERGEGWGEGLFLCSWSQCMRKVERQLMTQNSKLYSFLPIPSNSDQMRPQNIFPLQTTSFLHTSGGSTKPTSLKIMNVLDRSKRTRRQLKTQASKLKTQNSNSTQLQLTPANSSYGHLRKIFLPKPLPFITAPAD